MTTLLIPPAGDGRSSAEFTFDMLQSGEYYAVAAEQPATLLEDLKTWVDDRTAEPAAVELEQWQSEEHAYIDFTIGDGLTKVLIGTYDGSSKDGVELKIGGKSMNIYNDQIITLADVRQLRDNLTALLSDPRLITVMA